MVVGSWTQFVVDAVLSLGLFFLAAKAHGRQIRLEREQAGYWNVTFGGQNPAWVMSLWRADRLRFWTITPLMMLAFVALFLSPIRPLFGDGEIPMAAGLAVAILLWSPVVAFAANGVLSWRRLTHGAASPSADGRMADAAWRKRAQRGSAAYWTVLVAVAVVVAVLAFR